MPTGSPICGGTSSVMDGIMEAWLWLILTALAIAAPFAYPRWTLRRALARRPLTVAGQAVLERSIPFYRKLEPDLQLQLQRGAAIPPPEEIRRLRRPRDQRRDPRDHRGPGLPAALNRRHRSTGRCIPSWSIPSAFLAAGKKSRSGRRHHADAPRCSGNRGATAASCCPGTTCKRGALEWTAGNNVVLHEFAHQLDSESGSNNGAPFLGNPDSYRSWAAGAVARFRKSAP